MTMPAIEFPTFSPACRVVRRDDPDFVTHAYQYAMTTFPERVWPAAIVRPSGPTADEDVATLIRYASAAGLSIAVRSGGHQYSGASSTWGDNIQLDLSDTYTDFDWNAETGIVRLGVSTTIDDFTVRLGKLGLFIPHGICGHVMAGGHAQTGGYGMLVRSFGLLADHVTAVDMFTADGVRRHVRRDTQDPDEAALFYAAFGGSPGNLGVVTQLYIRPRHDKDYPKSRGLKLMAPYDHELTRKVMQSMVDFCIDDPRGFDYQITVSSINPHLLQRDPEGAVAFLSTGWHEQPFRSGTPRELRPKQPVPVIYVTIGFGNPDGEHEEFNPKWFNELKRIFGPYWVWMSKACKFLDGTAEVPMSQVDRHWVFKAPREFSKPYVKIAQNTLDTHRLNETGFAEALTEYIDDLVKSEHLGLHQVVQLSAVGGANAEVTRADKEHKTAFPYRDVTMNLVYDVFYDVNKDPGARDLCVQKQLDATRKFVGPEGCFSVRDLRYSWGSHGDHDMNNVWHCYMDAQTYERVLSARRRWDPEQVFAANSMCVGWSEGRRTALAEPVAPPDGSFDASRLDDDQTVRWFDEQMRRFASDRRAHQANRSLHERRAREF